MFITTREQVLGKANMKYPLLFSVLNDVPAMVKYYSNVDKLYDLYKKQDFYKPLQSKKGYEKQIYNYTTNALYILISHTKSCKLLSNSRTNIKYIKFADRRAGSISCYCDEPSLVDQLYNIMSKHHFYIQSFDNLTIESEVHDVIQSYASDIIQWLNQNRISNDLVVYLHGRYVKVTCAFPEIAEAVKVFTQLSDASDFEKVYESMPSYKKDLVHIGDIL